ncbi:MAG: radical SAM protein [Alphaproteobacteria bacterium]|nr:radical SAM protein [Alphaproteobacteria bacterium]
MSRVVAPIQLGCCHEEERCRLCPPAPPWPTADYVRALIANTRAQRGTDDVVTAFFGGRPPDDAQLAASSGRTIAARVRPDLLTRAAADRLREHGVGEIELDVLTFDTRVLRGIRRRYPGERVVTMATELRAQGFQVGLVLAVGLPGSDHEQCVEDARIATGLADTVRIHPTLVLDRSGLKQAHMDGMYAPLTIAQAVTTCRAMLDVLEPAGVRVIRVGQQPGPDGLGTAVAGPRHSSLRELVEARRTLDRLRDLLRNEGVQGDVVIRCASADETRTRGPLNDNVRTLRAEFGLRELTIRPDPELGRGAFVVEEAS